MDKIEFRRERYVSEYLDPRRGFAPTQVPVEVRWDPLTGQSCRLLPEGSIPPPSRYDLEQLSNETRTNCPFCTDALEEQTPRFPVDVVPEGRIQVGECVLFPNLYARPIPIGGVGGAPAEADAVARGRGDRSHLIPSPTTGSCPRVLLQVLLARARRSSPAGCRMLLPCGAARSTSRRSASVVRSRRGRRYA